MDQDTTAYTPHLNQTIVQFVGKQVFLYLAHLFRFAKIRDFPLLPTSLFHWKYTARHAKL